MYESSIDGIGTVALSGRHVFVKLTERTPQKDLALIAGGTENPMLPCAVCHARRFDLALSATPDIRWQDGVRGPMNIGVNMLREWCLPDLDTLQIGFHGSDPGYEIQLATPIEIRAAEAPLRFRCKLAIHRARADLVLQVQTAAGRILDTQRVAFDETAVGGTDATAYQEVDMALPHGFRAGSVALSLAYRGPTEQSHFPPFLFLADAHVTEAPVADISGGALVLATDAKTRRAGPDRSGRWRRATLPGNLCDLQPAFIRHGRRLEVVRSASVERARAFFDEAYYRASNEDLDFSLIDPFTQYLFRGWVERRKPNAEFSVREYLVRHPELGRTGQEPLLHYANTGQADGFSLGVFDEKLSEIWAESETPLPDAPEAAIFARAQDMLVPMSLIDTRKLIVLIVPEHNAMSGGIYSMFSIADHIRRSRAQHGFDVLVMTRPNRDGATYIRNSSFRNSETVFRFDQIRLFSEVSHLQLLIPEYATVDFLHNTSQRTLEYLLNRDHLHINILNQNTRLMPEPETFRDLRRIADSIGQSVSHHAFFGQAFADHYDLPSLLLPAYTDLTPYPPLPATEKENLIIYSDDEAPYRRAVLEKLAQLDDYRLVRIRDMDFDSYMDLATRCRFSVSFGEGFDGYVAQPIYQGGIGFALFTDEFFPDSSYRGFETFFGSEEEMIDEIVPTIRRLEADPARYVALNRALRAKWDALYSYDDYVARIGRLVRGEYELFPGGCIAPEQAVAAS